MNHMETIIWLGVIALVLWFFLNRTRKGKAVREGIQQKRRVDAATEEAYYNQVARELESGQVRAGLWAKAFADASGDTARARARYIKLRVASLKLNDGPAIEYREGDAASQVAPPPTASRQTDQTEGMVVISCPVCEARLRVAGGKLLHVKCPACEFVFERQT